LSTGRPATPNVVVGTGTVVVVLLPLFAVVVVVALVVVVATLAVVVVTAGVVVELAESVLVTGKLVEVVAPPAAATMRGDAFGTASSNTIVVTTPSATTAAPRGFSSGVSKRAMLEATRTKPNRNRDGERRAESQ
jgi:hypothetical protein